MKLQRTALVDADGMGTSARFRSVCPERDREPNSGEFLSEQELPPEEQGQLPIQRGDLHNGWVFPALNLQIYATDRVAAAMFSEGHQA